MPDRDELIKRINAKRGGASSTPASVPPPAAQPPPPPAAEPFRPKSVLEWLQWARGFVPGQKRVVTPAPAQPPVDPGTAAEPESTEAKEEKDRIALRYPLTTGGRIVAVLTAGFLLFLVWLLNNLLSGIEPTAGHFASQPVSYGLDGWVGAGQFMLGVVVVGFALVDIVRRVRRASRSDDETTWKTFLTKEFVRVFTIAALVLLFCVLPFIPGLNKLPLVWLAVRGLGLGLIIWYAWWRGTSSSARSIGKDDKTKNYEPAVAPRPALAGVGVICLILFFGPGMVFFSQGDNPVPPPPAAVQVDPAAVCGATAAGNPAACAALLQENINVILTNYMENQRSCEEKRGYGAQSQQASLDFGACQMRLYGDGSVGGSKASSQKAILSDCRLKEALKGQCTDLELRFARSDPAKPFVP